MYCRTRADNQTRDSVGGKQLKGNSDHLLARGRCAGRGGCGGRKGCREAASSDPPQSAHSIWLSTSSTWRSGNTHRQPSQCSSFSTATPDRARRRRAARSEGRRCWALMSVAWVTRVKTPVNSGYNPVTLCGPSGEPAGPVPGSGSVHTRRWNSRRSRGQSGANLAAPRPTGAVHAVACPRTDVPAPAARWRCPPRRAR